jgi:hypothetical protein
VAGPIKTLREEQRGDFRLRLVRTSGGYSGLVFSKKGVLKKLDGADPEALWTALEGEAAKENPSFFGYQGARERFLRIFGGGFDTAAYITRERQYKVEARNRLLSEVPLESAGAGSGYGEAILKVFQATNLLSPFEKMRIKDVLRSKSADAFIRAAADFTRGEIQAGLKAMVTVLRPYDAAKWTTVTYLPFLWRPEAHMFLKPEVTREFAGRVGHPFSQVYEPTLKESVYRSLLDLAATIEEQVGNLTPTDRIDIQSFIWVVGEYTESDIAPDHRDSARRASRE